MTRVHDRERNLQFRGWYGRHILIDGEGECEFWMLDRPTGQRRLRTDDGLVDPVSA